MGFDTIFFITAYLPAALVLYHVIPAKFRKARNVMLLVLSILFYAWGEPVYVALLLYDAVCTYFLGRDIEKKLALGRPRAASRSVLFGIVLNTFILCFFRYYDMLVASLGLLFRTTLHSKSIAVPMGIAFFTLQAIAYLLDIWEEKGEAIKDPVGFGLYLMLFPKLIAGPLVSLQEMASQITDRRESRAVFGAGLSRFIVGFAKKVILADTIGVVWNNIASIAPADLSLLTAWIGAFAFGFELYFDFSGYTDMALGLAGMFGFVLPENFQYPFTAKSVTEFWRRFNITVTAWFRERILTPMSGNGSMGLRVRSLFLVWVLLGIWHGPAWHYLVWGALMGLIMVLERFTFGRRLQRLPGFLRHIYTILLVTVTWAMFAKDSVADGFRYMGAMFGGTGKLLDSAGWYYLRTNLPLFVILILASRPYGKRLKEQYVKTSEDNGYIYVTVGYILLFVLSLAFASAQSAVTPMFYQL